MLSNTSNAIFCEGKKKCWFMVNMANVQQEKETELHDDKSQ